jgi:glycosyltransferase involved in cell wall biosynthesis
VIAALGLNPQLPVVSCLGLIREYKSADLACRAVECLRGQVQLVIGGKPIGGFDTAPLREAARRAPYVVVIARRLSDQEIADVIAASDAVLLPYRKITGSAVLMSALGAGCGVVAADLPYFREMLSPEFDAGVLVEGRDETTWARAIAAYVARDPAARRQAALRLADRYRWDRSVAHVLDAIENASSRSHPSSIEVSRRRLHA